MVTWASLVPLAASEIETFLASASQALATTSESTAAMLLYSPNPKCRSTFEAQCHLVLVRVGAHWKHSKWSMMDRPIAAPSATGTALPIRRATGAMCTASPGATKE